MKKTPTTKQPNAQQTLFGILFALSLAHCLNDTMQSLISAIYPLLKENLALSFAEIGAITLTYQISASVIQPICGYIFDRKPNAWFLPFGLTFTMLGLLMISVSGSLAMLFAAVFFAGIGSSVLHPEASRLTSMAAGGKRGLAQSIFQVGGSFGYSLGPLLAAIFVTPYGQGHVAIFSVCALVAIVGLMPVSRWYAAKLAREKAASKAAAQAAVEPAEADSSAGGSNASQTSSAIQSGVSQTKQKPLPRRLVWTILAILIFLVFTKNAYTISISNYYTFFLIQKFGLSVESAQYMLFAFLLSAALGTLLGGPIGDRIGRRLVIWWSILGAAPFALIMPYANLTWTFILSIVIGFIMSSAFSAILVYAQELFPKRVGMVSGLFFGFAFGFAGIMSAVFGNAADAFGIESVYKIIAYVPLLGIVAYFLPRVRTLQAMKSEK